MNASYLWLRDFVDFTLAPRELRDLLTARCATVEDLVPLNRGLSDIVVARVIEAGRHPDSDHLWLTKVDAGSGVVHQVVCGAPNVQAGTLYPFAPVGATLPGGLRIEKRKIRGQTSEGMLCSARELGLGTDHEGILALSVDAAPGTKFVDVMEGADTRLVIDVLTDRPDLLSHEGIAREIAAATGLSLHLPAVDGMARGAASSDARSVSSSAHPGITIEVPDTEGCPRYAAVIIRGVRIGPSPEWLASRIEAVGGRSVSNVVDVTNYMLHGFGQPMHAFDLARLAGPKIIVRRAGHGEKLVTLDGVDRTLDDNMTVIADSDRAQAIAGVIGGKGSEVSNDTTDILLEVAAFDPRRVRATRKKLGISTDASYRFERGVDVDAIPSLLEYASRMIMAVAGGTASEASDSRPGRAQLRVLDLRVSRVAQVLGQTITSDEIEQLLGRIGFAVAMGNDEVLSVTVPSHRADVDGEIELIEEVARLYGYERFSSEIRPFRPGTVPDAPMHLATRRVQSACVSAGLLEARPMPFTRTGPDARRVRNPLAEDEAFLRSSILDSLARRAEYNLAHMQRNVRLFEVGVVFPGEGTRDGALPIERMHAGAVILGERRPPHFTEPKPPNFDQWDAKALGETIASAAFPEAEIHSAPSVGDVLWTVIADGVDVGSVTRLEIDAPVWAAPAFGVEIDLEALPPSTRRTTRYVAIPAMPAIEVDLALIVPNATTSAEVEQTIRTSAGDLLESLTLFDEFRGPGIPENARSLAWRLTFRHHERTLREKEIQGRTAKILGALEGALGIRQRTS
ncbi:MAG TPA: phenylalanine--tRNA ligase subunit beta [Gemmatimonadaceae bacterium]|nr:phenylalanine--tRNA ligase subunit beta [Gemmatimonadaceae bacterium]